MRNKARNRKPIDVPVSVDEGSDVFHQLREPEKRRDYFKNNGYVIVRGLIPLGACTELVELFRRDVKAYTGPMLRFPSYDFETHRFDVNGRVANRVAQLQSAPKSLERFVGESLSILTSRLIADELTSLFDSESVLAQTFYFEGNNNTPAHRDIDYFPEGIERTITTWVALEDINPGAGRFYVYPGSQEFKLPVQFRRHILPATGTERRYLAIVRRAAFSSGLEWSAPAMQTGDVLFLDGRTIHGSLGTYQPQFSRNSMTGFFYPATTKPEVPVEIINGMRVLPNPTHYLK